MQYCRFPTVLKQAWTSVRAEKFDDANDENPPIVDLSHVLCSSLRHLLSSGLPQGSGVGASAAAELLEEAALPQGGDGGSKDSANP